MKHIFQILTSVLAEITSQDNKWGPDRSHLDVAKSVPGVATVSVHVNGLLSADHAKQNVDHLSKHGIITWADILMEEVCEALEEEDGDKRAAELIQVAAVCMQWVNDIRSRT